MLSSRLNDSDYCPNIAVKTKSINAIRLNTITINIRIDLKINYSKYACKWPFVLIADSSDTI